jgi:hypothetical protein
MAPTGTPEAERGARSDEATGRDADLRAEVQTFLDGFARALTRGDAPGIASMWHVPAFVFGDDMTTPVHSRAQLEEFFGGAKGEYNDRGVTDTRAQITRLTELTDRIVSVDVRWPYLDAHGGEVGGESSTYLLRRDEDGAFAIVVAAMHGEEAH